MPNPTCKSGVLRIRAIGAKSISSTKFLQVSITRDAPAEAAVLLNPGPCPITAFPPAAAIWSAIVGCMILNEFTESLSIGRFPAMITVEDSRKCSRVDNKFTAVSTCTDYSTTTEGQAYSAARLHPASGRRML